LKEYQRLRAEGRWPQANEFREAERKRLRAVGRNRRKARGESWSAMLAKYPPVVQANSAPPAVESERLKETAEGVFIKHSADEWMELSKLAQDPSAWDDSLEGALRWASGFRDIEVMPFRAPSVLAWLLWKLCRADAYRFVVLYITDYYLRHGRQVAFLPGKTEREKGVQQQMREDMKLDEFLGRLDDEDHRLGKSPTLLEALGNAMTRAETDRLMSQVIQRREAEQGLDQRSPASNASKS
jgi:hypothetical protein